MAGHSGILFKVRKISSYQNQEVFGYLEGVVGLERPFKGEQMPSQGFEGFQIRPGQIDVCGIRPVSGSHRLVIIVPVAKRMRR